MNRGDIPGFYWDDEKQKYFRIQANHLAPQGAKYAKGSVKQAERVTKKRKRENEKTAKRQKHIRRNRVLSDALVAGIGLQREHGSRSESHIYRSREEAVILQWQPQRIEFKFPTCGNCNSVELLEAKYLPDTKQMLFTSSHNYTSVSVIDVCNWDWDWNWHHPSLPKESRGRFHVADEPGLAAFDTPAGNEYPTEISSLSTQVYNDVRRVVATADNGSHTNVYMGMIPPPDSDLFSPVEMYLDLGPLEETALSASAMNSITGFTAIRGLQGIYSINHLGDHNKSTDFLKAYDETYSPCIDWLGAHTVAFANNVSSANKRGQVMLWDTRDPRAVSNRFLLPKRVTGISSMSMDPGTAGGHQLLVSTNHSINLFDTRMHRSTSKANSQPLLSLTHVHEGPRLQYAASSIPGFQDLIAAVDRDDIVQIYSTRTGDFVDRLMVPQGPKPRYQPVGSLDWGEDAKGVPTFMVHKGNAVVRWSCGILDSVRAAFA